MAKSDYLSASDVVFAQQLITFKTSIGGYAATLGVTPAQVTAQAADADYFNYVVASQTIMQNGAQQWTNWKGLTRGGGASPPAGAPTAPVFPTAVPAFAPGIEGRFRALVKQIKANANYNSAIGEALGIEGAQQTGPDLTTIQPGVEADQRQPCRYQLGLGRQQRFPRHARAGGRSRRRQRFHLFGERHHARLHRHPRLPLHSDEVDLPRGRPARRSVEQTGQRHRRRLTAF